MTFIRQGKKIIKMPLKILCLKGDTSIFCSIKASSQGYSAQRLQKK